MLEFEFEPDVLPKLLVFAEFPLLPKVLFPLAAFEAVFELETDPEFDDEGVLTVVLLLTVGLETEVEPAMLLAAEFDPEFEVEVEGVVFVVTTDGLAVEVDPELAPDIEPEVSLWAKANVGGPVANIDIHRGSQTRFMYPLLRIGRGD